jgi:hypothetical protein
MSNLNSDEMKFKGKKGLKLINLSKALTAVFLIFISWNAV